MPIFSFGENDIYDQVENSPGSWLWWFQNRILKSIRFSIPLFYGRGVFQYSLGFMPYRRPITTVGETGPGLGGEGLWIKRPGLLLQGDLDIEQYSLDFVEHTFWYIKHIYQQVTL